MTESEVIPEPPPRTVKPQDNPAQPQDSSSQHIGPSLEQLRTLFPVQPQARSSQQTGSDPSQSPVAIVEYAYDIDD